MPPLPFASIAKLDVRKLRDYALNPDDARGRHKARVLRASLGITAEDAEWLRVEILRQVPLREAVAVAADIYGVRYRVDVLVTRLDRRVVIRTGWIVEPGSDVPRLVSCWVP